MEFDKIIQEHEDKIIVKTSPFVAESSDLQRTEEWFLQRLGRFTGSGIKNLMKTSRSTSKIEWGRAEKILDFSDTAIKYVYEKAMERKRQKVIRLIPSLAMKYGTEQEEVVVDLFLDKSYHLTIKNKGFLEFIPGVAGASPDGLLTDKITGEKFGYEGKCATNWDAVFLRMEKPFEQSHQDFWQIQAEMLALKVKSLYYCTAEPSESLLEPNITDVQFKKVDASEIHQQSLIHRCHIGNKAIELFLDGENIFNAIDKACTDYDGLN